MNIRNLSKALDIADRIAAIDSLIKAINEDGNLKIINANNDYDRLDKEFNQDLRKLLVKQRDKLIVEYKRLEFKKNTYKDRNY